MIARAVAVASRLPARAVAVARALATRRSAIRSIASAVADPPASIVAVGVIRGVMVALAVSVGELVLVRVGRWVGRAVTVGVGVLVVAVPISGSGPPLDAYTKPTMPSTRIAAITPATIAGANDCRSTAIVTRTVAWPPSVASKTAPL